jgi:beta-lactamase regulating signal transducer with metallopeptidase domain
MIRAVIASAIVLGLAGLAATLAHRASASVRHAIWFVGLVTALGVGALAVAGPLIEIKSSFVKSPGVIDFPADFTESFRGTATPMQTIANQAPRAIAWVSAARIRTDSLLIALWAMGVALIIGRALFAHVAVARLISRSRHLGADLRLDVDASIDVRLSHDVDGPFTLGVLRPVILLPLDAEYWTSERLRIVLVHEAAHVARLDYIAQLVATVACAIYWFNPITWLAASRLRAEAEHAADDRVLAAGVDGVTYASHLLALAQPGRAPLSTAIAVRMARGTTRLEKRFTAMLDSQRSRGIVPLRLQAAIGSAAMLVAVPFTSMRLIPVEPKAPPITLSEPAPLAVVAPVVMTTGKPVVPKLRQAKPTQSTRSFQQADTIVERTVAASPGETISINLRSGGGVTIRSWNQSQVRVRGILSGTLARQTEVLIARVGGGVELRTITPEYRGDWIIRNSFEIWVPTRFNVNISSAGGAISISGIEGRFSGNTTGGGITLDNVSGRADLTEGGGEVSVTNSNLEGSVSTGGGRAVLRNTSGPVSVTSASGPVIRDGGGSDADTVRYPGGAIRFDNLPNGGNFITGGGEIDIGAVGGKASFITGGGNIRIMNASDDLTVATGVGLVEISVIGAGARNISVATSLGRAVIELPANIDARLDIESGYTGDHGKPVFGEVPKIESDFPVNLSEREGRNGNGTPRWYVTALGTIGSGRGLIKIRTNHGDVVIRRR